MARSRKGDRVLITEGAFTGQWAVIVDKDVIGDELSAASGELEANRIAAFPSARRPARSVALTSS